MGKGKKKVETFVFTSSQSPEAFKLALREAVRAQGEMLYEDTEYGFNLGVERGGHSGGYWYVATVTETESGAEMCGKIVYYGLDDNGEYRKNTKWKKLGDWLFEAVFFLIFLIPILIFYAVKGIARLVGKLRGKPVKWTMTTEEKLTLFMTEVVGCDIIE